MSTSLTRYLTRTLVLILGFSLFDALIHGGIAAAMQRAGSYNQTVSDMYQLGFAIAMAAVFVMVFFGLHWKRETIAVLILLFGFVEDTLYYAVMPLVNPLIRVLTGGAIYHVQGEGLFPPAIAGWVGWLSRAAGADTIYLSMGTIVIINILACAGGVAVCAGRSLPRHQNATTVRS